MNKIRKIFSFILIAVFAMGMLSLTAMASAETDEETIGAYGMLPIYGMDVEDGEYTIEAESDILALNGISALLTVSEGEMTALLTPDASVDAVLVVEGSQINSEADGSFQIPIKALDCRLSCQFSAQNGEEETGVLLLRADTLPESALLVELPDYELIQAALERYEAQTDAEKGLADTVPVEAVTVELEDGEYSVALAMEGGSGKASVVSPTIMIVRDQRAYARIEWSSANYDYMVVGTETYWNTSEEGVNSVFEIPIGCWDEKMPVIGDTTAMGTPHEVQYYFTFYQESIGGKGQLPQEAAKRVVVVALVIIVGGGILNGVLKKKKRDYNTGKHH